MGTDSRITEAFEFQAGNYSLLYSAGEVRCRETGKSHVSQSVALTVYLTELLKNQIQGNREGVDFDAVPRVGNSRHTVHMSNLRKIIKGIVTDEDIVNAAIPPSDSNNVYKTFFDKVVPHVIDSSNSLLGSRGDEDVYTEMRRFVAEAEHHMGELIEDLVLLYGRDLQDFFLRTRSGKRLPVFVMDEARFGTPTWPLPVSKGTRSAADRGRHSLVRQRFIENGKLYNGNIYRLDTATPGSWTLGKTRYFDVLDSCDILRARIFGEWGQAYASGVVARRKVLEASPWVAEWLGHVRAIRTGDFSTYCAGLAMNMPIFVSHGRDLVLLLAEGAATKAAGGGKLHVCPAGMMEFYKNTLAPTVSFNDFRTMMVRELYEEAFKSPVLVEEEVHQLLEGDFASSEHFDDVTATQGTACGFDFLEVLFNRTEKWMEEDMGNSTPLRLSRHVRSLTSDAKTYQVIDAFRLRPEIIMPVHLDYVPNLFLGWEYKGTSIDLQHFSSLDDLETYVDGHMTKWAEPGLAGLYLTARDLLAES